MKIKKIIFILCGIFLLCGCQKSENDITDKEYNNADKTADKEYKLEYETKVNGGAVSYIFDNKEYLYILTLTGRSNNAAKDSCYTVLSNSKELDFATVDNRFWSSQYNGNSEFVIVGYTLVEV